ncbi:MAG: L-histidine N(alpha)-methyltransferase [Williamsia sp.]|nr:L-histidine N(alpha)-methyltransferase [Williamsia sp.]
MNPFYQDVLRGLSAPFKQLDSKYFYDQQGDQIFEEIMDCPEYYLTNCELEILSQQSAAIIDTVLAYQGAFDVIELGAGNALKSSFFLREMMNKKASFTYFPVDISANVISLLQRELPASLPGIRIQPLQGEYLDALHKATSLSKQNKLVLFLGANIGNFSVESALRFCEEIRHQLLPGDLLLTGFDLAKDPRIILAAYNDKAGITKRFNLNLLHRINTELEADFDLAQYEHYPTYDPQTGACKSYLVSLQEQTVRLGEADFISFKKGEPVLTENSQKYTLAQIENMAAQCGFQLCRHFFDSRKWFVDSLWICA